MRFMAVQTGGFWGAVETPQPGFYMAPYSQVRLGGLLWSAVVKCRTLNASAVVSIQPISVC